MSSIEMNLDMVIEILSRSPSSVVEKCRILNKECNKRTYESSFLELNLQRTNSVFGYFVEYTGREKNDYPFIKVPINNLGKSEISLDFLPQGRLMIEACDTSHGILVCVNATPIRERGPLYMVCKPTTKQYIIIPKPKTRYFAIAFGLMVTGSNPVQYKILRLSDLPSREKSRYNFNSTYVCEVFDSETNAWRRLKDVELPRDDSIGMSTPVSSYGYLHWLTRSNNVFRFCLITETWSFFPVPENLAKERYLKLTKYEGKLAVISSVSKEGVGYQEIWVLESSYGSSWVNEKEINTRGLEAVGFSSNDVVMLSGWHDVCLYNMSNGKSQSIRIVSSNRPPMSHYSTLKYFPISSDYQRVKFQGGKLDNYLNFAQRNCMLNV